LGHEEKSQEYTYELMTESPPEKLKTLADIANFGEEIRKRFILWWEKSRDSDFSKQVLTYFGMTSRHELLERTVWHSTQHIRQLQSLLESIKIKPDKKVGVENFIGLPLNDNIWN